MVESPYKEPMDIARGLQELATFIRSCGFPQAAQLIDAAAVSARKQITPIMKRIDQNISQQKGGPPLRSLSGPRKAAQH
jgi:hypothetical protein